MPAEEPKTTKKQESLPSPEAETKPIQEVEKDLVVWTAPARPFKRRDREFYVTVIAIAGIVSLILFLVEGFMPVLLIISIVFLVYVMNTVEPENIAYKITNKGVVVSDRKTPWQELTRFWFSRRFNSELLIFEKITLPGRLEIVINQEDKEKIKKTLSDYLPEEEAPPLFLDKAANWFVRKMPGN